MIAATTKPMTKPMTNKQRSKDVRKTPAFKHRMLMASISDEWDLARCRYWYATAMRELTFACSSTSNETFRRNWIMHFLQSRRTYIDRATSLKTVNIKVMRLPN